MKTLASTAGCVAISLALAGCFSERSPRTPMSNETNPASDEPAPVKSGPVKSAPPQSTSESTAPATTSSETAPVDQPASTSEIATLGAGCFWCIEAVLEQIDGISDVKSGYMGGEVKNPTYRQICTGTTGHAEVVQVTFDPSRITYAKVLDYFWKLHDPTTLNRQGGDVGPQYRSAIFYHSDEQRQVAEASKKALDASGVYLDPAVTEITAASKFYEAEAYHQDYYRLNKSASYCRFVIAPKLDKLGLEE